MKVRDGLRESAGQFGPLAAMAVGLALLIALVPSAGSNNTRAGSSFDLRQGGAADKGALGVGGPGAAGTSPDVGPGGTGVADATANPGGPRSGPGSGSGGPSGGSAGTTPGGSSVAAGSLFGAPDCSRQKVIPELPCRPTWRGKDNGGALDRGVAKDKIRLVIYATPGNEQVNAILKAAGAASAEDTQAAIDAHTRFWNKYFETYHRKIEVIWKVGPGNGADPAQMQADATAVATELKAFAVVSVSSAQAFHKELARRGVPNFTAILPMTRKVLNNSAPFTYSLLPESDLLFQHFSEYWCSRLRGGMAEHAGDPLMTSQPRKLGIIHIEQDYANLGADLDGWLQRTCGMKAAKSASYTPDITRAAQIAANVIAQMKEAGVTTVTCVCDPIAPIFLTDEASRQRWFPEWIHNGFYGGDSASAGRLYDQVQWSHSFGPSSVPYPVSTGDAGNFRAYWDIMGDKGTYKQATAAGLEFELLRPVLDAIEQTGPQLTTETFLRTLLNKPATPERKLKQGWGVRASFGEGAAKVAPYSYIDDLMEIWYDPSRQPPDGSAQPGYMHYVDGGRRHLLGTWPRGKPNVFVDDKSEQPGPDEAARCKCRR